MNIRKIRFTLATLTLVSLTSYTNAASVNIPISTTTATSSLTSGDNVTIVGNYDTNNHGTLSVDSSITLGSISLSKQAGDTSGGTNSGAYVGLINILSTNSLTVTGKLGDYTGGNLSVPRTISFAGNGSLTTRDGVFLYEVTAATNNQGNMYLNLRKPSVTSDHDLSYFIGTSSNRIANLTVNGNNNSNETRLVMFNDVYVSNFTVNNSALIELNNKLECTSSFNTNCTYSFSNATINSGSYVKVGGGNAIITNSNITGAGTFYIARDATNGDQVQFSGSNAISSNLKFQLDATGSEYLKVNNSSTLDLTGLRNININYINNNTADVPAAGRTDIVIVDGSSGTLLIDVSKISVTIDEAYVGAFKKIAYAPRVSGSKLYIDTYDVSKFFVNSGENSEMAGMLLKSSAGGTMLDSLKTQFMQQGSSISAASTANEKISLASDTNVATTIATTGKINNIIGSRMAFLSNQVSGFSSGNNGQKTFKLNSQTSMVDKSVDSGDLVDERGVRKFISKRQANLSKKEQAFDEKLGKQKFKSINTTQQKTVTKKSDARLTVSADKEKLDQEEGWALWMQGFGGEATQNTLTNQEGYKLNTSGGVVGADTTVNGKKLSSIFGASLAFGNSRIKSRLLGNKVTDINTYQASLYNRVAAKDHLGFYNENILTFGMNEYKTRRNIEVGTFKATPLAQFWGRQYLARFTFGYNQKIFDSLLLSPYSYYEHNRIYQEDYSETGAGNAGMYVTNSSFFNNATALGIKTVAKMKIGELEILPEYDYSWIHNYRKQGQKSTISFIGSTGNSIDVRGNGLLENTYNHGFALGIAGKDSSINARFDLGLGKGFVSRIGSIQYRLKF